jgi:hypothetical protein
MVRSEGIILILDTIPRLQGKGLEKRIALGAHRMKPDIKVGPSEIATVPCIAAGPTDDKIRSSGMWPKASETFKP